jgi:5-formyltetrahydrofolate cyclo-ligase
LEALTSVSSDKPELRRHFRAARAAFIARSGSESSTRLSAHLLRLVRDLGPGPVLVYHPLFDEARFQLESESLYYPRVEGDKLAFYRPNNPEAFLKGGLGMLEPDPERSTPLDPAQGFVICCPGVAFDWQGGRIGMGKGFYDRFLGAHPRGVRVGVGYQIQVSKDPLPADSWDQTMDWIVTEEMVLRTSNRSL